MEHTHYAGHGSRPGDTRRLNVLPLVAAIVISLLPLSRAAAQQGVRGRVVDDATRSGIVGAEVELLDSAGKRVESAVTDDAGGFLVRVAQPGVYRLHARMLGYQTVASDTLTVEPGELVEITLRLGIAAIPLAPLTVVERSRVYHDDTYDGLYARHALIPAVGSNRVWVKGDRDFESAIRRSDMLRLVKPATRVSDDPLAAPMACPPIVFWQGIRQPRGRVAGLLDGSMDETEGFEVYFDIHSIPLAYRHQLQEVALRTIRECGVVALWARRPDYPKR